MAANYPRIIALPFAANGTKTTIQVASHGGGSALASYNDGFPSITLTPSASGGLLPYGGDFNGVLFDLSQFQTWVNGGGQFLFNTSYASAIGYAVGAVVILDDHSGSFVNLTNNNTLNPNSGIGTPNGWFPWSGVYSLSGNYIADVGSANAYSGTVYPTPTAYRNGLLASFKASHTNTAASTINLGAGVATLVRNDGQPVTAGDIVSGSVYSIIYDFTTSSFRLLAPVLSQTVPVGAMFDWGGASVPGGYLACDGSAVSRSTYAALFSVCGVTWGTGDGSTTFNIPDFKGRVAVGAGTGSGLTTRVVGAKSGEENHILSLTETPAHTHNTSVNMYNELGGTDNHMASGGDTAEAYTWSANTDSKGGDGGHNNMQPFLVATKIIKY